MDKKKKRNPVAQYFINLLISLDQMGSALRGWSPDETISSMLGKMERYYGKDFKSRRHLAWLLSRSLNRIEQQHCSKAIEEDEGEEAVADHNIATGGQKCSKK
jgi:hypothetical protein